MGELIPLYRRWAFSINISTGDENNCNSFTLPERVLISHIEMSAAHIFLKFIISVIHTLPR